ncbi:MAG: hypothetical protein FD134_1432, partial [Gallionellaceae bacterium]
MGGCGRPGQWRDGNLEFRRKRDLSIGRKTVGSSAILHGGGADGALVLGGNSVLSVGTAAARANLYVGSNETVAGTVVGLLDARQGVADIHAANFSVGYSTGGAATGTLRWDRPTVLDVTNMYFGRGVGTGVLDLAAGGTFLLGSAGSRTSLLAIGYNDSYAGSGKALANLDLSVNDPTFAAYVSNDLSIGRKTVGSSAILHGGGA